MKGADGSAWLKTAFVDPTRFQYCRRTKHRGGPAVRRPLVICTPVVSLEFFIADWLYRAASFDRRYLSGNGVKHCADNRPVAPG